jgi:uncharacterized phage infection (PIP) family protein YhgE
MNEILKKIDETRNTLWKSRNQTPAWVIEETINLLNETEKLIQAKQKEKTNFDVITESPEKLAKWIRDYLTCDNCKLYNITCTKDIKTCRERIETYLNHKIEEE